MVTATLTIYNKVYPKYIHRHPHKTQPTHKENPPPHKKYTEKVCNKKEIPFVDRRRYGTFPTSMTQVRRCIGHKDTLGRSLVEALGTGGPLVGSPPTTKPRKSIQSAKRRKSRRLATREKRKQRRANIESGNTAASVLIRQGKSGGESERKRERVRVGLGIQCIFHR